MFRSAPILSSFGYLKVLVADPGNLNVRVLNTRTAVDLRFQVGAWRVLIFCDSAILTCKHKKMKIKFKIKIKVHGTEIIIIGIHAVINRGFRLCGLVLMSEHGVQNPDAWK